MLTLSPQLPLATLTVVTTIGSYNGIGAKDSTFARPGNKKYIETAYFVRLHLPPTDIINMRYQC
jgi:hypothetical protein